MHSTSNLPHPQGFLPRICSDESNGKERKEALGTRLTKQKHIYFLNVQTNVRPKLKVSGHFVRWIILSLAQVMSYGYFKAYSKNLFQGVNRIIHVFSKMSGCPKGANTDGDQRRPLQQLH